MPDPPGYAYQEPPYDGPYSAVTYDPNVYATLRQDREDEIRWCKRCMKLVIIDNRPGFQHPHFQWDEQGNLAP